MAYHQRLRFEEEHNRQQPQRNAGRSGLDGSAKEIRNHHHQKASKDQVSKSELFSQRLAGHLCGFFSSMYFGACDAGHAAPRIRLKNRFLLPEMRRPYQYAKDGNTERTYCKGKTSATGKRLVESQPSLFPTTTVHFRTCHFLTRPF